MTYDVVVLGGGPGGSTLATLLAKTAKRVLLLERERFPRHQIGESLLPLTIHGICPLLGLAEALKAQDYVVKKGSVFRWGKSQELWGFEFAGLKILDQANADYSYQVERSKFDQLLLDNARRHGVDVREEHLATGLVIEGDRIVGVRFRDVEGREQSVRAAFVADTGGHSSTIQRHIGERLHSRFFQNVAMYGYFAGAGRLPPPFGPGNTLSAAFDEGWFWFIPLSDELTSVGAVIDRKHADVFNGDRHAAFARLAAGCPPIRDLLAPARRVEEGQYGQFRIRKDWSYTSTRFWRPGALMLGDAAAFIDPVFSQGVHLATYAALLAARTINTMLDTPDSDEPGLFGEFERRYRMEFERFYNFLVTFYDMGQDVESYYWSARKFNRTEESANDAFISLVSGVSSGEFFHGAAPLSAKLRSYVEAPGRKNFTQAGKYVWEGFRLSNEIEVSGEAVREGGYVPSADGLHWIAA